jgi:hypothetical protein
VTPPTYSVRFMHGRGAGQTVSYSVPSGRRAVVRFIAVSAFAAAGQSAFVFVAGAVVLYWPAPAANAAAFWDVRMVAYAGETVLLQTNGSDVAFHVSGFLFLDPGGRVAELEDDVGELERQAVKL